MHVATSERTLTELDHVRLLNLLRRDAPHSTPAAIEDVLDGCSLVPSRDVTPDVVTMGSKVLVQDRETGRRTTLTLSYPARAEPALGLVSVLSPVGSAMLGLRAGSIARWLTPAGVERSARVLAVLFQPESSGDFAA